MNKELSIKKYWLFSLFLVFSLDVLSFSICLLPDDFDVPKEYITICTVYAIKWAFYLPMFYFFSYKKGGTWLLNGVIISPLVLLTKLANKNESEFALSCIPFIEVFRSTDLLVIIYNVIYSSAWCWFYVMCWKLKEVNKYANSMLNSKECQNDLKDIKEASALDELNSIFYDAIIRWPHHEKILSKAYHAKKSELGALSSV